MTMNNPVLIGLLTMFALFSTTLTMFGILGLSFGDALLLTVTLFSLIGQAAFKWMLLHFHKKGED